MASPAETLSNLSTGWKKLDINQKMIIVVTVVLFLSALGTLIFWVSRPSYSVLFTNLSPDDASAIVGKLQEKKIEYKLDGASTIEVPSDQVYETRIQLAGEGLPEGGTVGFEIFDNSNFGLSEFQQKTNYRRALEGELARTITQISGIDAARVHIVMPEPSLYSEKENPATASIVVKARAGARMASEQVQGIVNLTAKSVEGLKADNITVVDTNGNVLNEGSDGSDMSAVAGYTRTQLEAKEAYENSLEESVQTMLAKVLGSESNAVVRVSAALDFTQKETSQEVVEQPETPAIQSATKENEKYTGTGQPPGGVSGMEAQTSGAGGTSTYPSGTSSSESSKYTSSKSTTNYLSNKKTEHIVEAPGQVKKLSVAVVVNNDGSKPIQDSTIESLVAAATGLDRDRGDVITVSSVPFDTEWIKKEELAMAEAQKSEMYATYAKYALVAILFIVGIVILLKIMAGFKSMSQPQPEFVGKPVSRMAPKVGIEIDEFDDEPDISDISPEKKREIAVMQRRRQRAREEIQSIARDRPGDVAQLIKIWLNT
jgi:flagellar M-ring protein FliF